MKRFSLSALSFVCFLSTLFPLPAQTNGSTPGGGSQSRDPLIDLVGKARSTPAEFSADALLRIARAPSSSLTAAKRQELIQEAFDLAEGAQEPVRLTIRAGGAETLAALLSSGFNREIDRVSLQSRAVLALLPMNAVAARRLAERIHTVGAPLLPCESALTVDFSRLADAIVAVTNQAFSKAERADERHLRFLSGFLGRLDSLSHLPMALRIIQRVEASTKEREALLVSSSQLLQSHMSDPAALASKSADIGRTLTALSGQVGSTDLRSFLSLYGARIAAQIANEICSDTDLNPFIRPNAAHDGDPARIEIEKFNALVDALLSDDVLALKLRPERIEVGRRKGRQRNPTLFLSGQGKKLWNDLLERGYRSSERDRLSNEWRTEIGQLFLDVTSWQAQKENELYFHEKTVLLKCLARIPQSHGGSGVRRQGSSLPPRPPNPLARNINRSDMVAEFTKFLDGSDAAAVFAKRRVEWLAPVAGFESAAMVFDDVERRALYTSLCGSPNANLSLIGSLGLMGLR